MTYKLFNKNILVTGGTGQVGSFLIEALIEERANIIVLGRNSRRLKEIKPLVDSKKIKFVECDLTNKKSLENLDFVDDIDFLIHLSSDLSPVSYHLLEEAHYSVKLNIDGLISLLSNFRNLSGILYSSSTAVYGTPKYLPVDENCSTNPFSFYGCAKLGAEKYLNLYSKNKSIPLTILRYSTVYGPRNRTAQVIPLFIKNALYDEPIILHGKGESSRDFIYIADIIDFTIQAIKKNESDIFNIGSGISHTMIDLADIIIELTNSKSKIIFSDYVKDFNFVCDTTKARRKLEYIPKISLEEGLKNEISWHKFHV